MIPMLMSKRDERGNLNLVRKRARVNAPGDHCKTLIAADIALYKAVFEVDGDWQNDVAEPSKTVWPNRKDPSTWPRPNLDKLKASTFA